MPWLSKPRVRARLTARDGGACSDELVEALEAARLEARERARLAALDGDGAAACELEEDSGGSTDMIEEAESYARPGLAAPGGGRRGLAGFG